MNIAFNGGLVNGARGVVTGILLNDGAHTALLYPDESLRPLLCPPRFCQRLERGDGCRKEE